MEGIGARFEGYLYLCGSMRITRSGTLLGKQDPAGIFFQSITVSTASHKFTDDRHLFTGHRQGIERITFV